MATHQPSQQPYLCGVEVRVQHAQIARDLVSSEHLQRDDERVVDEIVVHGVMEDVHRSVVRARAHQRVVRVELRLANRLLVVAQRLERRGGEVQIEPRQTRVVRADDEVVSAGVNLRQSHTLVVRPWWRPTCSPS